VRLTCNDLPFTIIRKRIYSEPELFADRMMAKGIEQGMKPLERINNEGMLKIPLVHGYVCVWVEKIN